MGSSLSNPLAFDGRGLRPFGLARPRVPLCAGNVSGLLLAGILESRLSGGGGARLLLREGMQAQGWSLRQAYERLPETERQALSARVPEQVLSEFFSLSQESDPEMMFEGLLNLGTRLSQEHQVELAMLVFSEVTAALGREFSGRPENHLGIRARAQRELDAMLGRGAVGARVEFLGRNLAEQASDPVALASMGMAGLAFSTVRMGMLSRLLASSGEGYFLRGIGARALASTVAFTTAELPAFVLTERGLREALGQRQDWSGRAIGRDLASAGITLSALKLAGFGTTGLLQRMEGEGAARSWLQGVSRSVLPQGGMLLGIMGGHRLEDVLGLRERVDGATSLTDALSTLLQFHVAGRLLETGMGAEYARWQQELHARSEALARVPRRGQDRGARPPFAELLQGAIPQMAGTGSRISTSRPERGIEFPTAWMSSMNDGDGDSTGKPPSLPPESLGVAPTVQQPLRGPRISPEQAEELGRAETVGPREAPAPDSEVEVPTGIYPPKTPGGVEAASPPAEAVEEEAAPLDSQGMGLTVVRDPAEPKGPSPLLAPRLPREAVPTISPEELAAQQQQTGVYDPLLLKAQREAAAARSFNPFDLQPGYRLGPKGKERYEVVRRLGGGGMGDVYEVIDLELGRQAAIKVIKMPEGRFRNEAARRAFWEETVKRFDREVKIGASLDERYTVAIYDQIELVPGGLRVPVMKFVPGRDLYSVMVGLSMGIPETQARYTPERRLDIFAKLCEAVDSIHEDGVVHRDLKPANIRITPDDHVLVMDFGLAKRQANGSKEPDSDSPQRRLSMPARSAQSANLTQAGVFQGTFGYMAPEIGEKHIQNFRSPDIFALGVILYEWMTGLPPFATYRNGDPTRGEPARVPEYEDLNDGGQAYRQIKAERFATFYWADPEKQDSYRPPSFRDISTEPQPEFFDELEAVARKAFHPDPAQRYQTAREMMQDALLAPARAKIRRLNKTKQEQMEELNRQMQDAWSNFTIATQLNPDQWTEMKRTIRDSRHVRSVWRQGLRDLATSIIETTRGDPWPEAKKMIARMSWDLLLDGGDRMDSSERHALRETIQKYDVAFLSASQDSEDSRASYREALDGSIPLRVNVAEIHSNKSILHGTRLRVLPYERVKDASGEETDRFQRGTTIAEGTVQGVLNNLRLSAGYWILELTRPGYKHMNVILPVDLENIRQGIVNPQGQELSLDIEMIPLSRLRPIHPEQDPVERARREKEMEIIHRGPATIGIDFDHEGAPDHFYGSPRRIMQFPTFAISRDPVTVAEYIEFIEDLLQQGRREEAQRHIPRATNPSEDKRLSPFQEYKRLRSEERLSVTKALKKVFSSWSGFTYSWKIVPDGKKGFRLENPIGQLDARNDPIVADQPINSIDLESAKAYVQWRAERDGLPYRLPHPDENEKVVRGSLPLTYPWGYESDPNAVASRLAHSNMEDIYPLPVGGHPRGADWYRDFTLYGTRDNLGNIREFTVDPRLPTLGVMAGGSMRAPMGPYFFPPGRAFLHKNVSEDGSGGFRLVLDFPPL